MTSQQDPSRRNAILSAAAAALAGAARSAGTCLLSASRSNLQIFNSPTHTSQPVLHALSPFIAGSCALVAAQGHRAPFLLGACAKVPVGDIRALRAVHTAYALFPAADAGAPAAQNYSTA